MATNRRGWVGALGALALAATAAARADEIPCAGLEFIGRGELAVGTSFAGAPVGGLSGLVWDERDGSYVALSDDRSEFAPARLYRLKIDLADGRLDPGDVAVVGQVQLADRQGRPWRAKSLDPEGVALGGASLFLSSEGEARLGLAPFVAELAADGRLGAELPLPERYLPRAGRGVRDNLAFESLAVSPDGSYLFSATENALVQEGPAADFGVASPARILRWRLGGHRAPPEEFAYRVEGVRTRPPEATAFRVNGLVDLVPLSRDRLIALERQFVDGVGNEARLYLVSLADATEISGRDRLDGADVVFADKQLLIDLGALGVPLDNLEGMTLGAPLPDGRRPLILISDDNFNPRWQKTQLFAFAVDARPATVAAIQGAGHRSPLEGHWLFGVEGVVTAVSDRPGRRGFWMESERPDGDAATSEGIYVDWEGASTLAPGARVAVNGRVVEAPPGAKQLTVTRLELVALVERPGRAELPPPARLFAGPPRPLVIDDDGLARFDPESDALDRWESLEGMRVEVAGGAVIGATTGYGEIVLLPEGAEARPRTVAGGVRREPAGPPLERILLSGRLLGGLPATDVGARVAGPVTGVVDYSFSNYQVLATATPALAPGRPACAERTALAAAPGRLTLATFNVENLSAAGPPERFAKLGRVLVEALGAPALVALQEIQDDSGPADDGVVTSSATLAALGHAVEAAGGPRYDAVWIDPENDREGGQPGGNIRVALLADPLRAKIVRRGDAGALDPAPILSGSRGPALGLSPARVAPTSPAFTLTEGEGVRRSLAVELEVAGAPWFLVINHWSSKYGDDRDYGAAQPPARASSAQREAQAEVVRAFAESLLRLDPGARVVVLGDLNDYEWSPAVARLGAPPFENLLLRLPEPDRYSYVFEGAAQLIDHVVASPAIARGAEVDAVHVNADCADSRRSSDHDPIVVRLRER